MTPDEQAVNARITETVEQLMKRTDTYATLAAATGITAQSVGRKMRGEREWTAAEVYLLARYFDVAESTLFAGSEALFVGVQRPAHTTYPGSIRQYLSDTAALTLAA